MARAVSLDRDAAVGLLGDLLLLLHELLERSHQQVSRLGCDEHPLAGEHRVVVAALEYEIGQRQRVRLACIEPLSVDFHIAHAIRWRCVSIDGHRHPRDRWKLPGGGRQLRDAAVQCLQQYAAGHRDFVDHVPKGMHRLRLLGEGARARNPLVEPLGEQSPTPIPSIRATHLASDPALLMSVRFSVVVIGKCSWPPITRSIAGNRCASLRSSSNARCVTATMIEAPWAFNAGMYFAAAAKGSTRRVCVSRSRAISVVVSTSPMNPTFSAPNVFTKYGAAPPIVLVSMTFEITHCHFASRMRCSSTSSPKSNSWLPSVARSSPAALSAATICSPLNTLEATDGDRKSPARTTNGIRPARP